MTQTFFEHSAHPSWVAALKPHLDKIAAIESEVHKRAKAGKAILPVAQNTYLALSRPINETKVLILGQDPYPTPGHAIGLAFSTDPEVRTLPKSLINIYNELEADLQISSAESGDLRPWQEQGIMLLNTALTVEAGDAGAHSKLWQNFTAEVIRILNDREQPLVSILWGRHAQNYESLLKQHPIIKSAHPSPLSAHRGFFGSRPFSKCNELLTEQGATPINWKLQ
ncbi:MAG: uracil-DNA glycosylase [Micrococcaceae bacterium]